MFNILRGYIKTWKFTLRIESKTAITEQYMRESVFKTGTKAGAIADYIKYTPSTATLEITRNPFGFTNKSKKGNHDGVRVGAWGETSDDQFVRDTVKSLKKEGMTVLTDTVVLNTALPDTPAEFNQYFIGDDNVVKNLELFKRRIIGLVSYFPDIYRLMPSYGAGDFHVIKIPMSNFQFGAYEEMRAIERKQEVNNARRRLRAQNAGIFEETASTYRMYSRAFCNFVFPAPEINRPFKIKPSAEELASAEEDVQIAEDTNYNARITEVLQPTAGTSRRVFEPGRTTNV